MKSWIPFLSPARNVDSFVAAILGYYLIQLLALHSGIGISPDSVTYLSVARNLHAGKGLIQFDLQPLVEFPLFYPVFLEVIHLISRVDSVVFAPVLNGLMFALVIYLSGAWMNGFTFRSSWYKRIILSCIVLSPSLIEIYSMMWSETLFLLLLMLYIAGMYRYFKLHSLGSLWRISIITALACITRYAGVSLIATGALLIMLDHRLRPARKICHLCIFCLAGYSLLAINLLRNFIATGTLTGLRQKGLTPLIQNIHYFGSTLCDWITVTRNNHSMALLVAFLVLGFFIVMMVALALNPAQLHTFEGISIVFFLVYSFFIILSATISRYQQLNSRLLSPLYIPLVWGLSFWLPPLLQTLRRWKRVMVLVLGLLATAGFQYNQYLTDYETWDGVKDAGIPGYTEDPWPVSPIANFIRQNRGIFQAGYTIYSNAGDAVYFFSGLNSDLLPQKVFPKQVEDFYHENKQYLVWFNDIDNPDIPDLQEILQRKNMIRILQFADGAIYIYNKSPTPSIIR